MTNTTKRTERLYLTSWQYNAAKILTELEKIVINNGGRVKEAYSNYTISNRSITNNIYENEKKIEHLKNSPVTDVEKLEEIKAIIEKLETENEKLNSIGNEPIEVKHTSYIVFKLNGIYYSYNLNDNPFFDFYICKTPIENGYYNSWALNEVDKKEWLFDCFFSYKCSEDDIKEAANLIFNMLVTMPNSTVSRKKQRVYCGSCSKYHYEWKIEKNMQKIDF